MLPWLCSASGSGSFVPLDLPDQPIQMPPRSSRAACSATARPPAGAAPLLVGRVTRFDTITRRLKLGFLSGFPGRPDASKGVTGPRARSEEHTSELPSLMRLSYA